MFKRLAALLAVAAVPAVAQTEGTINLERFRPSLDRSGFFSVEGAATPGHLNYDAGLFLGYELNPLVLQVKSDGLTRQGGLIGHKFGANVVGAIGLLDFLQVGVDIPVVLFQIPTLNDPVLQSFAKPLPVAALGDIRIAPKAQLLHQKDAVVDLGVMAGFTLPTNTPAGSFAGDQLPTFMPEVLVGKNLLGDGDGGPLRLEGNLGLRLRSPATLVDLEAGQEFTYRLGANYRVIDALRVGVNADGALGFSALNINGAPLELLAGATYDIGDNLEAGVGFGVGVLGGAGTPDFRGLASIRWSPREGGKDTDADGVRDADDKCADTAEDKDGFEDSDGCLDDDNDGDGVKDASDAAPNDAEDNDGFEDSDGAPDLDNDKDGVKDADDKCRDVAGTDNGCPPKDTDGDGISDGKDACPTSAGPEKDKGCPDTDADGFADNVDGCVDVPGNIVGCPDKDGDGVTDNKDMCPNELESKNGVQDTDGCPEPDTDKDGVVDPVDNCPKEKGDPANAGCVKKQKVAIQAGKTIDISETVNFTTGKAEIEARSFALLDNVAEVLKAHPEITKVQVEGHTDNEGEETANKTLSEARVASVIAYLVKKGVEANRLEGIGYGPTKPIADNNTPEGRALNRRVAFTIVGIPVK